MWLYQRQAAAAKKKTKKLSSKRRSKRKRPWPKFPYDPAKVQRRPATPEQIDQLISLSKGEVSAHEGAWFYKQFIRFSNGLAKSPEQVRQYLSQAYWVNEDDVRQQIRVILWLFEERQAVILDEYFKIAQALRVYLIKDEKVFQPNRARLQALYQYDLELAHADGEVQDPQRGLDIVFQESQMFNTFDKYVFYLRYCLGQTEKQLSKTLLLGIENAINIKRSLDRRIKESEEQNVRSQNTKRYRGPTLAIFTNR